MNCRHCTLCLAFALSTLLAGCQHNSRHVAAAPPPPPDITPQMISVPPPSHPSEPLPAQPVVAIATPAAPVVEPTRKVRKPRKAAAVTPAPSLTTPAPAVQTATAAPPPELPGTLGQLSTGGESNGQALQQATELVRAQQSRLNSLTTAQQSQYKTEVEQVKRFLTQADEALKSSDAEGARTLAVKAKVLLDEIQK